VKILLSRRNIIFFCLIFLYVFGPTLDTPLGQFGSISFLISILLVSYTFLRYGALFGLKDCWPMVGIFILVLITIIPDPNLLIGMRALFRPLKSILLTTAGASLVMLFFSFGRKGTPTERDIIELFTILYLVIVLHGIIMVAQFMFPPFKNFIYEFTYAKYQLDYNKLFRMAGLSGGGGAQISAVQGLGFILAAYLFAKKANSLIVILGLGPILMSIILSGRTGFIVMLLAIVLHCIFAIKVGVKPARLAITVLGGSVLIVGMSFLFGHLNSFDYFSVAFDRSFDTVTNYGNSGKFEDETLNA
jgi:hypothetical protein